MEFILDILKSASAIFVFCVSGMTIILSLRGQRFQWGISPKGPSAPAFLMRAWLLFGGTYAMWWSSVRLGLESHLLTDRSRAVTLLAFVTNHVGRIVIHLFLIVVFAFFGISMARMARPKTGGYGECVSRRGHLPSPYRNLREPDCVIALFVPILIGAGPSVRFLVGGAGGPAFRWHSHTVGAERHG